MNRKQLAEILKYSSSKEIFAVTWDNRLLTLKCPFKVKVIKEVATIKLGQILTVDKVKTSFDLKTVFMIEGKAYFYHYFDLIIEYST